MIYKAINNMNKSDKYIKQKLDTKEYLLHNSIYIKYKNRQN